MADSRPNQDSMSWVTVTFVNSLCIALKEGPPALLVVSRMPFVHRRRRRTENSLTHLWRGEESWHGAAMPGCGCPNDERASGNERADEAADDDDEYEYEPLSVCATSIQAFLGVPCIA